MSETPQSPQTSKKLRVMSGMRTSGSLHFGHYFGVLRNWNQLQSDYECYFGAMDWHGMTTLYKDTKSVDPWIRENVADWIAWGLDPAKCTIFVQSLVPEHLETFMIFANLTPMGWLERVPTWKDAEEQAKQSDTHNLGRFAYPVLQAADIAVYLGQKVPIGADQVSHLEISREIIRRFNHLYKAKLPEPQPLLTDTSAVPGIDGRKMSSSYGNFLQLTAEAKDIEKRTKQMMTDPKRVRREDVGDPEVCPVYAYHKLFSTAEDLSWAANGCRTAGIGCGDCKMRLAQNINSLSEKPREKKKELLNNPKELDSIILDGSHKARAVAQKTIKIMREAMKFQSGVI